MNLHPMPALPAAPRLMTGRRSVHPVGPPLSSARLIGFLLAHAPLAMAMKANPLLATLHAVVVFVIGFKTAAQARDPRSVLYVMGYIIASEPIWRASRAMIFHESAKYAVAGLAMLSLSRFRLARYSDKAALLFFLLLLPSVFILPEFDREMISFNLSGPFALAMCTLFMSTLKIPPRMLGSLFLVMLAPIFGVAFLATFSTLTTEILNFYGSKATSGGLGQNQASSILCLGGLLAFLFLCIERRNRLLGVFVAAIGIWSTAQGALTFSRGGVATTIGAALTASFYLLQDRSFRGAVVVRLALIAALAVFVIVPAIDSFTGGAFKNRFSSTDLTGRDKIIEADIMAFRENPLLGVGPGQSQAYHVRTFRWSRAHTEYSRLLAEHGILGLLALALLAWMSLRRMMRRAPPVSKAITAALTAWTLLFMFHAAMRMAAAAFIFALGSAYLMAADRPPVRSKVRTLRMMQVPGRASRALPRQGRLRFLGDVGQST